MSTVVVGEAPGGVVVSEPPRRLADFEYSVLRAAFDNLVWVPPSIVHRGMLKTLFSILPDKALKDVDWTPTFTLRVNKESTCSASIGTVVGTAESRRADFELLACGFQACKFVSVYRDIGRLLQDDPSAFSEMEGNKGYIADTRDAQSLANLVVLFPVLHLARLDGRGGHNIRQLARLGSSSKSKLGKPSLRGQAVLDALKSAECSPILRQYYLGEVSARHMEGDSQGDLQQAQVDLAHSELIRAVDQAISAKTGMTMAQIRAREKRERGRRDGNAGDAASDDSAGSSVEGSVDGGVESDGDLTARPHDSDSDDDDLADSDGDDGKRRMREVVLREKRTATRQKKFYRQAKGAASGLRSAVHGGSGEKVRYDYPQGAQALWGAEWLPVVITGHELADGQYSYVVKQETRGKRETWTVAASEVRRFVLPAARVGRDGTARGMEAAEFKTLTDYVPQPVVGLLGRWTSSYRAGDAVWAYQGGDASHSSSARSDERCWYAAFVWSVSSEFVVVLFDDGAMESMHHPDLLLPPSDVSPAQIRGMFDWLYAPDTQLRSDQRSCFGFADEKRNCTLALCASDSSVVKLDSSAFSGPVLLMRMWSDLTSERALTLLQRCLWFGVVDPAGEDSVVVSEKDVWWRASSLLSDHHSVDVVGGGRVGVDGVVLYMFAKRGFLKKGTHAMVVDGVAHVTKGPPELRGWHLYEDPIDGSGSDRGDLRVQCGGSDDDEEYVSGATGSMEDAGELTCVQLRDKLKGLGLPCSGVRAVLVKRLADAGGSAGVEGGGAGARGRGVRGTRSRNSRSRKPRSRRPRSRDDEGRDDDEGGDRADLKSAVAFQEGDFVRVGVGPGSYLGTVRSVVSFRAPLSTPSSYRVEPYAPGSGSGTPELRTAEAGLVEAAFVPDDVIERRDAGAPETPADEMEQYDSAHSWLSGDSSDSDDDDGDESAGDDASDVRARLAEAQAEVARLQRRLAEGRKRKR